MKALDLFSGLGGWSDGLALEGFEILGVELEPLIAGLYKHPVIVSDVKDLNPMDFTGYDLIVGSPPCRDFSILAKTLGHRWKDPPNPKRGLILVNAFLNFVEKAKPRYWLMENVPGLTEHLSLKPRVKTHLSRGMIRCFWGTFPSFLIPKDYNKKLISKTNSAKGSEYKNPGVIHFDSWLRAKIPIPLSRALGRAINDKKGIK